MGWRCHRLAWFLFVGALLAAMVGASPNSRAAVYQWSVPMLPGEDRRAYLWIPPDCQRVRGLIVGLQNMLEKPMLQDPEVRRAAAESGLGIVWISPGSDPAPGNTTPLGLNFSPREEATQALQQTLTDLARESGYREIEFAPLLAVGHSAATPFVWGMGEWDPSRVFAILPYKGWYPGSAPKNIPILHVAQEWVEFGAGWGEAWEKNERPSSTRLLGGSNAPLLGEFVDVGAGHFDWTPDSAKVIALFIREAVEYRIPDDAPLDRPVTLKPARPESGWLIDPAKLGTGEGNPVPYGDWPGDPKTAYWYFDKKLARAANDYAAERFRKKPQMIDFVLDSRPAPLEKSGFVDIHPQLSDDGVTFRVEATFLDQSPTPNLYAGTPLGHAPGPIQFRVGSGALEQVGPERFRVKIDRGGVQRQGPPWEPWIIAYHPGDRQYRPADRPAHIWIEVRNKAGKPQTITFPEISTQSVTAKSVTLRATSDSGLPVQYFIISGPVELAGDRLIFQPIPRRSQFPVRVLVAAYQWGRANEPKMQSAGPVVREFFIDQPAGAVSTPIHQVTALPGQETHRAVDTRSTPGSIPVPASSQAAKVPARFQHPGLLHTRADLDRMKQMVAAGVEPWKSGFERLKANAESSADWKVRGPFASVSRDARDDTHNGELAADGNAAYQNALMWTITGDEAHAKKAVEILNAWSPVLKEIKGHDKELAASLYGFKYVNAAEIIRYTYNGWKPADIQQFEGLLRNVFYPVVKSFAPFANGNWDTGCIKTMMAIGVFLDDRKIFDRAVEYYYQGSGNGRLTHYIINETGQCQESGRDQQHTQLGIAHLAESCEIGWNQGLDMYGASDNRLLKGFEYTARYNLGYDVPFEPYTDTTGNYSHKVISAEGRGNLRPIYEMLLNHYTSRRGIQAPYIKQAAEKLRPEGAAFQSDHPGFGTLLFTRVPTSPK